MTAAKVWQSIPSRNVLKTISPLSHAPRSLPSLLPTLPTSNPPRAALHRYPLASLKHGEQCPNRVKAASPTTSEPSKNGTCTHFFFGLRRNCGEGARAMHSKVAIARPSWLALKVLALISVLVCVGLVYEGMWGEVGGLVIWPGSGMGRFDGDGGKDVVGAVDVGGEETGMVGDEMHPIKQLMAAAEKDFVLKMGEQATSLSDAAQKYRVRRGRHPPPGFDKWYAYATEHDALVVESFFDQIYDDLGPFWGVDVYDLRRITQSFRPKISIREGVVDSAAKNSYDRMRAMVDIFGELVKEDGVEVPDMDIPFNTNEGVGMLAEWEQVDTAVELARPIPALADDVIEGFASIDEEYANSTFDAEWLDARLRHTTHAENYGPRPFWSVVRPACPPDSPARKEPLLADIWDKNGHTKEEHSAAAMLPLEAPDGGYGGYVMNWTVAVDACLWPSLQGLHGGLVAPEEMSVTKKLFPLFSATKMGVSNEVLVPSASSWNTSHDRSSSLPWAERQDKLYWHGPATGGKNSAINWQRFHRHRFVSMLNATHVEIAEGLLHAGNETMVGLGYARNFRLLPGNEFRLATQKGGRMAEWVNSWADAAFTDLHCNVASERGGCAYTDQYFSLAPSSTSTSDGGKGYRYAAVIDDNGGDDSGEFVDALKAGKMTLKATIYKQWYDSRVVPWVHFVPMDNTFVDLYGIMEFFLGTRIREGAGAFAHAHVELPKHEHHFQTPHSGIEDEEGHEEPEDEHDSSHDATMKRTEGVEDGHDNEAQKIAEAGQAWAPKVLRKEDMSVYLYRLLLEYARVVDTRRKRLGWAEDLKAEGGR